MSEKLTAEYCVGQTFRFETLEPDKRLGELMLYVAQKCEGEALFNATVLNKILFWSDFLSFRDRGKPITGCEYMREKYGPVPKRLLPIRIAMEGKDLVVKKRPLLDYQQDRVVALRNPKLNDFFTAEDIAFVDSVIDDLRGLTAEQTSELTHGRVWKSVPNGEPIPYEAIFISNEDVTASDIDWARQVKESRRGSRSV